MVANRRRLVIRPQAGVEVRHPIMLWAYRPGVASGPEGWHARDPYSGHGM